MILAFSIIIGLYFVSMMLLIYGFGRLRVFSSEAPQPSTKFSVIIPFRNEAENLGPLLKSISKLNYPSDFFEILFVNDESADSSEEFIYSSIEESNISIQLLQNERHSNSPKKDAISKAIQHSKFDWIVTTDADCELPINWLKTLDTFIQSEIQNETELMMVCGPVLYKSNGSFLQDFQQMDGFSLQAVTMGSFGLQNPMLSNGANLAYRKDGFNSVNGFSGNDDIASGDDIFLMEKMKNTHPQGVKFLKSAEFIVLTKPQLSWQNVINQRIRWASKTSKQKNVFSIVLGILVFLTNLIFLLIPFVAVFDFQNIPIYSLLFIIKIINDFILIRKTAKFLGTNISLLKFTSLSIIYSALIIPIFFGSFSGKYSWKDRAFHK